MYTHPFSFRFFREHRTFKSKGNLGVPVVAQWLTNPTKNHEVSGSIPGLAQQIGDLVLLWLWCRPVATARIRPLAWEPPYASGAALEKAKKRQKKRNCPKLELEADTMSPRGSVNEKGGSRDPSRLHRSHHCKCTASSRPQPLLQGHLTRP